MTNGDAAMTNAGEGRETVADFVEYRFAKWLWVYVAPALLVVGVIGNALSLVVLLGRTFRKSSLSFTLGALSIVDTAVLCTALPRQWLLFLTDDELDIRASIGTFGCKLHFFLTYYLSHLSTCWQRPTRLTCLIR